MMKRFAQHTARALGRKKAGGAVVFAVAMLLAFLPEIAAACDATGLFTLGGGDKKCNPAQTGVFSGILCFFETALEAMLGTMYCGFMTSMRVPVTAAMSLAVSIFGLCVLTGYIRMQFREAAKMVLKMALVTAFVFNSDYAIRMVGTLFMGMLQTGTAFIMAPLGGSNVLTQPDSAITGLFNFMSNPNLSQMDATNNCNGQPCLNDAVLRIITNCATFLAVIGIGLMVFLPVVFGFLIMMFIQYIGLYVKAILSYLTSIVIICFLLVLGPLFISFALFTPTYRLFERWLQYLRMFSIQGLIMFSFLAMLGVATQGLTGFLYGMLRLLRPYDMAMVVMLWTIPISNACSICEYKIEQLATGSQTIKCQPAINKVVDTPAAVTPSDFPPRSGGIGVTGGTNATATMPNGISPTTPVTYDLTMGAVLSNIENDMPGEPEQHQGYNYVIPIMTLLSKADFVLYVAMNIIAFGIIASLFQEFIGKSGEMARKLGGVSGAGGFGGHADFEGGGIALGGMKSVEAGIKGMSREMLRNPFSNARGDDIFNRFKDGMFGRNTVNRRDFQTEEGYLEAKKGEMLSGGFVGGMMHGVADDQKEKEREYDLKLAQRRVDDAALKVKQARETAEIDARGLSDALDEQERARKSGTASEQLKAAAKVETAKSQYDKTYKAALEGQNTLRKRKQDLRDAEYDMRASLSGGMLPAGGRVIESGSTGAALLSASSTMRRTQKRLEEEDEFKRTGKAKTFTKKTADPNAAAAASQASRTNRSQSSGRANSTDELLTAQEEANQKIADLERQMTQYKRFLTDAERTEYEKALVTAKAGLGRAKSERDTYEAMKGLNSMEASLDRFSDRHVAENSALVGTAALGTSLVAASGVVSSGYLKEVKKFVDGAEKESKSGAAGAAKVNGELERQTKKLAASTVAGAKDSNAMAASIVPQSALPQSTAQVAKADAALQAAKSPEDYLRVVNQLEGSQETQLREVLAKLMGQKEVAQATLNSAAANPLGWDTAVATLDTATALPAGWDGALYQDKRKYMENLLNRTQQELDSTAGVRSEQENEAHKKEMEKIRAGLDTASSEEEFKELLRRTTALGQKARASILPTSPMNMFASFDEMMQIAQESANSARTGNDHSAAMRSVLGAPQALNQTVIGGLQQHMDNYKDNKLLPEELRRKMALQLEEARKQTQSATTGQQQEDILTTLGRQFVGGGEADATIAMARWDNLPEDRKRQEAQAILEKTRQEYEKLAPRLTQEQRKEYEAELTKASAALSSATSADQMRGAVAHSLSINGVLDQSATVLRQQGRDEESRAARARMEEAMDVPIGDTTTGQMARNVPIMKHVSNTMGNWNSVTGDKRREYEEAVLDSLDAHYKDAESALSESDKARYGKAAAEIRDTYGEARKKLAAAGTEAEQKAAENEMAEITKKAAALEAHLHEIAEQDEAIKRQARAQEDSADVKLDEDEERYRHTNIKDYMPAVNASVLTGNPGMGYELYAMQTLTGFNRMGDRKREYVGGFIEKSKLEIDTFTKLSDDEKKKYKAELERVSAGLATEASDKEMRDALAQALKTVGKIDAREAQAPAAPQLVSAAGVAGGMPVAASVAATPVSWPGAQVTSSATSATGAAAGRPGVQAATSPPAAPGAAPPPPPPPMSESVGKIEVAGKTYVTSRVYDRLDDSDKERVQRILSRNPEMTLEQAITRMNDEQAVRRRRAKEERSWWEDDGDGDGKSSESKDTSGSGKNPTTVANPQRDSERRRGEDKKKRTLDNLTPGQRESIRKMMEKNPGMSQEQALINLTLKGKTQ